MILLGILPLEHWLARHPFNKVLAGVEFENDLHEVVRLGLLWNYGGIDPTVRVSGGFTFHKCQDAWISKWSRMSGDGVPILLDASYFPKTSVHWKASKALCQRVSKRRL